MDKVFCPILNREIDRLECFDAALVFEEMSPLSELPDSIQFTDANAKTCLNCKDHPN